MSLVHVAGRSWRGWIQAHRWHCHEFMPDRLPMYRLLSQMSCLSGCCKTATRQPQGRGPLCPSDCNASQRDRAHRRALGHMSTNLTASRGQWDWLGSKSGGMSPPSEQQNKDGRQGVSQRRTWWLWPENRQNQNYPRHFPLGDTERRAVLCA